MTEPTKPGLHAACMLADHLDAALAAGEDLVAAGQRFADAAGQADFSPSRLVAMRAAVEGMRALELALISRVLKARQWAQDVAEVDPNFKILARLFASGTVPLADVIAECADATQADFDTGDGITAYLRGRGLLDSECAALNAAGAPIAVTDQFLIAQRIALGPLLDLVAAFLDALEAQFSLFAEPVVRLSTDAAAPAVALPC